MSSTGDTASFASSTSSTPPAGASSHSPYLPANLTSTVSGFLRRFASEPSSSHFSSYQQPSQSSTLTPNTSSSSPMNGTYTPQRHASPFQPPPLYPLSLSGFRSAASVSSSILSRALAEEIRLLVPPRLQLVDNWTLTYSLEQDGASLHTLYQNCVQYEGTRTGYVLVVRDSGGGTFGAYLTDAPKPAPHYFGTGECFLWRASILPSTPLLSSLPPPPSSDTTNMTRSTTVSAPKPSSRFAAPGSSSSLAPPSATASSSQSGASTPERIRFKAFPYSGVNDYLMFCEQGFLSIGGGDGHYGLWLDSSFEKGISSFCPTFGNEPLSDDGQKFDVLDVELWNIGHAEHS
ncbi:MAG: hypothetical protein M4579_003029 [Chaenotheca gracillima]|nr:MAG: hypothetical protein M4579_003029 [Chaenotheca gracillima]